MATFTVEGTLHGQVVHLTWDDGELSGDTSALRLVRALADGAEGSAIWTPGHLGPVLNHLSDPYQVYALMKMAFSGPLRITAGGLPPLPAPPARAVQ